MNESAARRVTLVQAFDDSDSPLWTREDKLWASRLAAETAPAGATPARLAIERARHALERLQPREPAIRRWLARSGWRWSVLGVAIAVGFGAGLAADLIGRGRHIDLLAPVLWGIVAWNLAIYALLALTALRHGMPANGWFRRLLAGWWERGTGGGPLREAASRWAAVSERLTTLRIAVVVHAAAAALGLGLVAGLYLRGLVFDFRAGWESTFLDAATVEAALRLLLAPASLVSGVAVPDASAISAMQVTPAAPLARASAAPVIHLYAATLLVFVIVPRVVLALVAFAGATARALRLDVPLADSGMDRLQRWHRHGAPVVQVLPYAQALDAQAVLGLRELLATELGEDLQLKMADVTQVGDEEAAQARGGAPGTALHVAVLDMAAIPEDEQHGRFVRALGRASAGSSSLLIVDETALRVRFVGLPGRLDERRQAWRDFAQRHAMRIVCVPLGHPDVRSAAESLQQAFQASPAALVVTKP